MKPRVELLLTETRPFGGLYIALQMDESVNVYADIEWDGNAERIRLLDAWDDDDEPVACLPGPMREFLESDRQLIEWAIESFEDWYQVQYSH